MNAAVAAQNAATHKVGGGAARARRRHARCRALSGQHRRQHPRRAARRADRIPCRQCRRGAAGGRQGLYDARHLLRLHGHLPADRGSRPGQDRGRGPHRARRLSRPCDPGEGGVRRQPGAIHAEDRRDQGRARQADVPDQGADRSGAAQRPRGDRQKRACRASPMCAPIRRVAWPASLQPSAPPSIRRFRHDVEQTARSRASTDVTPALRQDHRPRRRYARRCRAAAWSG